MKKPLYVLAILATGSVGVADVLLLGVPAFRNGWWTLAFFAFPAAFLALAKGKEPGKLGVAAWAVFLLGLGGYVGLRLGFGNISATPGVAVGQRAPDFKLRDSDGGIVHLGDLTSRRRVVLVFMRGKG